MKLSSHCQKRFNCQPRLFVSWSHHSRHWLITADLSHRIWLSLFFKKYICVAENLQITDKKTTIHLSHGVWNFYLSTGYFTKKSQIPCWGSLFLFPLCLQKSQNTQIELKFSLYSTLVSVPFSPSLCKIKRLFWPMGVPMQPCMNIRFKRWSENIF